jgi:hypothetical protein
MSETRRGSLLIFYQTEENRPAITFRIYTHRDAWGWNALGITCDTQSVRTRFDGELWDIDMFKGAFRRFTCIEVT